MSSAQNVRLVERLRARLADLVRFGPRDAPPLVGVERVAHWLAIASMAFFTLAAFWESLGPMRAGHLSAGSAYAMAGENMVHWRKFGVYCGYLTKPGVPDQFYYHHPYGITVVEAFLYLIFGHHWFTVRAGGIFCSVFAVPLLYAFGRRAWGVIPAAAATIVFVFIPVDLAFATMSNLEEPTIFFGVLFMWASSRLWDTSETKYLVLSALGALGCCNGDWAGMVFIGPVGVFAFFRAYVIPRRWYGRLDEKMYAKWFAYTVAMAVGTLLMYLAIFGKADKLGDLMGSYHLRTSGAEDALKDQISQRRKLWLAFMLTPLSYWIIGIGIPLAVIRLVKKPLEIFGIAWFISASFQYFVFKQGADIHIFWPYYYAPTAALAAGSLAASILWTRERLVQLGARVRRLAWFPRAVRMVTASLVGAVLVIPLVLLARMGVPQLVQSRKTAGRFDQGGHYIATDGDMAEFAKWAYSNVPAFGSSGQMSTGQVLEKYDYNFSSEYAGDRPYTRVNALTATKPEDVQRIALVDTRTQPVKELEKIASQFAVQAVGPLWRVDRAVKAPAFSALRYEEREPTPLEWYFISGTDLVRKITREEDPWLTWEWRDALGLPAPTPTVTPVTPDDLRIAHNAAVRDQDTARAEELRAKLAGMVGRPLGWNYTGGVHLLGVDVKPGPAIRVTLFWEIDRTYRKVDVSYQVKCKIVAPPKLWVGPMDYFEKDMSPMATMRPGNWKPGYLYAEHFVALHRIGREECRGAFSGAELRPVAGEDPSRVLMTFE